MNKRLIDIVMGIYGDVMSAFSAYLTTFDMDKEDMTLMQVEYCRGYSAAIKDVADILARRAEEVKALNNGEE